MTDAGSDTTEWDETLARVACPCSSAMSRELSIVDMGLVRELQRVGDTVEIAIELTEPSCIFGFSIAEEIERTLKAEHPDVSEVRVTFAEWQGIWTEDRITPAARARLERIRRRDAATIREVEDAR